ncbi:MAG TPA: DHH family phosphoesterase, partial [Spirochaetota bacterium]|nr:DHH family phosphoesterase [Spirochaetota bacterium]
MNLDFKESANTIISILRVQKHIAIFIKGSPDPDAIASSYFLYCLCNALHVQATMFAFMPASLPSNREIISLFSIPLHIEDTIKAINMRRYSGYIVCDFQTAALEGIVNVIPCLIHLDHHAPVEDDVSAHFRILTDDVASTSTLCALIMQYISCFP